MHRSRLLVAPLALALFVVLGSAGSANAQSGVPAADGSCHLVVSRASTPAPVVWASTAQSLDAAKHWAAVALANTRNWVLSFAPARVAVNSRPVAVMRRATP